MASKFFEPPIAGEVFSGRLFHVDDRTPLSPAEDNQVASQVNVAVERDHSGWWLNPSTDREVLRVHGQEVTVLGRAVCAITQDEIGVIPINKDKAS